MTVEYWEERWRHGPDCPGSVGRGAEAKAEWLNLFVLDHGVESVVDLGCGDGTVAGLVAVDSYVGIDVAPAAVVLALGRRYPGNASFVLLRPGADVSVRAELAVSMDVVFHLDACDFQAHMDRLFRSATRYVAVHSTDHDADPAGHMHHHAVSTFAAPAGWRCFMQPPDPLEAGWTVWARRWD